MILVIETRKRKKINQKPSRYRYLKLLIKLKQKQDNVND